MQRLSPLDVVPAQEQLRLRNCENDFREREKKPKHTTGDRERKKGSEDNLELHCE